MKCGTGTSRSRLKELTGRSDLLPGPAPCGLNLLNQVQFGNLRIFFYLKDSDQRRGGWTAGLGHVDMFVDSGCSTESLMSPVKLHFST